MISSRMMEFLIIQYVVIMICSLVEGSMWQALYWFSSVLITIEILGMK